MTTHPSRRLRSSSERVRYVSRGLGRRLQRDFHERRNNPALNNEVRTASSDRAWSIWNHAIQSYDQGIAVSPMYFAGFEAWAADFIVSHAEDDPRVAEVRAARLRLADLRAELAPVRARGDRRSAPARFTAPYRPNVFRAGPSAQVIADRDIRLTAAPPPSPVSDPSIESSSPPPGLAAVPAAPLLTILIVLASLLDALLQRVLIWISVLQANTVHAPVPSADCGTSYDRILHWLADVAAASQASDSAPSPKRDDDHDGSTGGANAVPAASTSVSAASGEVQPAAPSPAPSNSVPTNILPPFDFKAEILRAKQEIAHINGEQNTLFLDGTLDARERSLRLRVQRDIAGRKLRHLCDEYDAYRYNQRQLARSSASNADAA
ncbi:hypothetical protein MKEN_00967700 [Mycena kentingensis (nom. inval.)]|nr:hypothetical protein MKEN_00967700 [Mycena kentingensis (nom. inval.)]